MRANARNAVRSHASENFLNPIAPRLARDLSSFGSFELQMPLQLHVQPTHPRSL